MDARPVSCGISADTDVNLDFLTKEEKEALLSKKMDMIRQRNKALSERHQMIEADKKKAEESGNAVKPVDSKHFPAEGAPKGRGRGRGQPHQREAARTPRERPKSSGDFRDSSNYEPIVDTSDLANYRHDPKGKGRGSFDRDGASNTPKNKRRPGPKDEATHYEPMSFEYEPIVDLSELDKRFARLEQNGDGAPHLHHAAPNHGGPKSNSRRQDDGRADRGGGRRKEPYSRPLSGDHPGNEYSGRLKGDDGPPPDPSFNPLADRRRTDKKEESGPDHRRHPRNYGGGADLTRVKQTMKVMRDKERDRPSPNKPLDLVMTGKERRNHEEWKKERERFDKERIQRQMDDSGGWKRAWDMEKVNQDIDDMPYSRVEPAKRPAGRIGSGRFDRGERDDRPRSAVIGKGGLQQQQTPQQQPHHHHKHHGGAGTPGAGSDSSEAQPMSPQPGGEGRAPGGRGRGRGRGRPRGRGSSGGDKSPRPRTWSGGEDNRLVECQKELLLVKFDNTAGDNSVEVEYEGNDLPSPSSATSPKSPGSTTPGRGPTGRTPNQSPTKQSRREGGPKANKHKNKHKGGKHDDADSPHPSRGQQGVVSPTQEGGAAVDERVRTLSHSHSYGDSEEWEDCTESSHSQGDQANADLHLECKLNPEAPEFLPTSPDFLKTPPGHVKVLNWAADGSSPTSPLSQASLTSPRLSSASSSTHAAATAAVTPPAAHPKTSPNASSGGDHSQGSSPGSSASVKAARRRAMLLEDAEANIDCMPDGDDPHPPPPFLIDAEPDKVVTAPQKEEEEEDEEGDKFEDVSEEIEVNTEADGTSKDEEITIDDTLSSAANSHSEVPQSSSTKAETSTLPAEEKKPDDIPTPSTLDTASQEAEDSDLATPTNESVTAKDESVAHVDEKATDEAESAPAHIEQISTSGEAISASAKDESATHVDEKVSIEDENASQAVESTSKVPEENAPIPSPSSASTAPPSDATPLSQTSQKPTEDKEMSADDASVPSHDSSKPQEVSTTLLAEPAAEAEKSSAVESESTPQSAESPKEDLSATAVETADASST